MTTRREAFDEEMKRADYARARVATLGEAARVFVASARDVLVLVEGAFTQGLGKRSSSGGGGGGGGGDIPPLYDADPLSWDGSGSASEQERADRDMTALIAKIRSAWSGGAVLSTALTRVEEAAKECQTPALEGEATMGVEAVVHRLRYGGGDGFFAVTRFVESTLVHLEEERALRAAHAAAAAEFAQWSAAGAVCSVFPALVRSSTLPDAFRLIVLCKTRRSVMPSPKLFTKKKLTCAWHCQAVCLLLSRAAAAGAHEATTLAPPALCVRKWDGKSKR